LRGYPARWLSRLHGRRASGRPDRPVRRLSGRRGTPRHSDLGARRRPRCHDRLRAVEGRGRPAPDVARSGLGRAAALAGLCQRQLWRDLVVPGAGRLPVRGAPARIRATAVSADPHGRSG
jgi:hypothetical protein